MKMSHKEEVVVDASGSGSLLQRRIEFHLARKPVSSYPNTCNFKLETLNPCTTSPSFRPHPVPPSSNKSDSSDFFGTSLDPDLSFRIPFRRIGAGLENLGNTCFLNSVLQCLTYTEPLVAYLQSGKHQNTCHVAGFCALCAIQKHVSRALQSTGRILAPKDLVSNLRCISRNFRNARQEDAHEYMIHLLESMHKCCLPSGVPTESPSAFEKSLVHKIFGGRLRSQVKCLQCSYCSNTFDPFLDLSLEIVKADSLYKALVHFTAAEQLDGGERQYKCERCKQKVKALKQLTVCKAPYVLTIHLKRFRSHFTGQKIDKKVHFGTILDLKPFVSGAYEGDLTYTLYGILVHAGWSTHSGHYYCFVRTSSGLWYSLDDNRVVQVSEKIVLEQKAYMLFYVRDRKSITPKKTMDIIQKENLITTIRNVSSSCPIPNIKAFQNGCADKNSRETIPSGLFVEDSEITNGILATQNVSRSVSSNKNASKKDLSQKVNGTISSGTLDLRKENPLLFKSYSVGTMHSRTESTDSSHARNSAKDTDPGNNSQNSAVKPSIIDCPSSVATDGCDRDSHVISTAEKIGSSDSPIQLGSESGECKEGAREPTLNIHSILSKSRAKLQSFDESFPMTPVSSTVRRRSVKKILKSRVAGMYLSTKMLLGASLTLRKRGKCGRMKLSRKNVMKKQLLSEDIVSMYTGPSTSVRVSSPTCVSVDCHTKDSNLCLCQEEKHPDFGNSKQRNCQLQNGAASAFTRPLEEIQVARWDGIESSSKIVESNSQDSFRIGYVLDDWDEEYDTGIRKKVRGLRHTFGGPNPFQEIAAKKTKLNV